MYHHVAPGRGAAPNKLSLAGVWYCARDPRTPRKNEGTGGASERAGAGAAGGNGNGNGRWSCNGGLSLINAAAPQNVSINGHH